MMNMRKAMGLLFFALCFQISCSKSGCAQKKEHKNLLESESAPAQEPQPEKKSATLSNFPSLNFKNLNAEQKDALTLLFNEEICPCACPKTFAQCINLKDGCKAATILGQWAIDQVILGAPERFLVQALSETINAGFMSTPKNIDVSTAHRMGTKKARLKIVEFADFQCPACRFASKELKAFMKEHKDTVDLYFMHYPLPKHEFAVSAAVAAEAAGKQGKFWQMHDLLFNYEGSLNQDAIKGLALNLFKGKSLEQFERDLEDESLLKKVKDHGEYARNTLNLRGTPSIFINGRQHRLSLGKESFLATMEMETSRNSISCSEE